MSGRPADLTYSLEERPPIWHQLAFGFQHVAVICPYLVMVALVVEAARLPHAVSRDAMGLAMIGVALLAVLQSLRLPGVGSGYLCPPVVSAIYLPAAMTAAASGFGAVCGMVMFAGGCEMVFARLVSRLRKFFPAVVSGVVIVAVGMELGKIGAGVLIHAASVPGAPAGPLAINAAIVLGVMTVLAVWGRGLPKMLCSLIGILAGYVAAAAWGLFPPELFSSRAGLPFFALPDPGFLSYAFDPALIIPFAIAGLASGLRVVGVLTTCQQMNDASWRRPDLRNIAAGVTADGLGCALGGALGTPGMSASPSLVGMEKTTGVTSRVIAWSVAGWLVVLACLPQFANLIVYMPRPVMAAALFFNGALMFVAGIQIVASRPITLRGSLIIGFSVLAALTVMVFPDFYRSLPAWTHQLTGSQITVAVLVAVTLNAVFLLGTWQFRQLHLGADGTPVAAGAFDAFFEERAREWKIPAEDARRIRTVVDEAIEHVSGSAEGPVRLETGFDTFDVSVTLEYTGNLPALPDLRPKREMVEEQSFVSGLTGYLSGLYADRIDRSAHGDSCRIRLLFRL